MAVSQTIKNRLATQGFVGLNESLLSQVEPWLRFSYALCAIGTGLGTILASPTILWLLVPIAALGAIFPTHPFDLIYNYGIRHFTKTPSLPANGAPKRFACGMGAVWLGLTAWAFGAGFTTVGYILGGIFTAIAVIAASTHFCIPSNMYCLVFGRPKANK